MRSPAVLVLLSACTEVGGSFDASVSFDAAEPLLLLEPEVLLDFGEVQAHREVMREATVTASRDVLVIDSIALAAGSPDKWRFEADDVLFAGLAPGESAKIRIYFRPCPEAWAGVVVDPAFAGSVCQRQVSAGALELESNAGRRSLSLAGRSGELPPMLATEPQDSLQFSWGGSLLAFSWSWLHLSNAGRAPLQIEEIELVQLHDHWAIDDCDTTPCRIDQTICASLDRCDVPMMSLRVKLYPPNPGPAELIIRSNDPERPELVVKLDAEASGCPQPSARIDQPFLLLGPEEQVVLDASGSLGGADNAVTKFHWSWIYTSTTPPPIEPNDSSIRVNIVARQPGAFVLGLDLENSCGARTTSPAPAIIVME